MYNVIFKIIINILYLFPLYISVSYFTFLRIIDIKGIIYDKDKVSYLVCVLLSFIPIINFIIAICIIKKQID